MSGGPCRRRNGRSPASLFVREAHPAEGLFVARLSSTAFRPFGSYAGIILEWFDSGKARTLVAHCGEHPAGFAMTARRPPDPGGPQGAELLAIAVAPGARRGGIGRVLLRRTETVYRAEGGDVIWLHTATGNGPARSLFEAEGFRVFDLKRRFYPRGQDALLMAKALSGEWV